MKIRDLGDGTVEITETVAEINAKAVAQGLPPPIVVIEQPAWGELAIKTRMTKAELKLRCNNDDNEGGMIEDSDSHSWKQIEMAAMGCISGTLAEWPHLKHALRQLGHHLPDSEPALTLRDLCRSIALRPPAPE